MGLDTSRWSHLADFVGHSIGALACFFVDCGHNKPILLVTQLCYADTCIVNIMKVYFERNNLQLELIRYSKKKCLVYSRLLLRSDGFAHRAHSRKFRTQTTSAPFLTV